MKGKWLIALLALLLIVPTPATAIAKGKNEHGRPASAGREQIKEVQQEQEEQQEEKKYKNHGQQVKDAVHKRNEHRKNGKHGQEDYKNHGQQVRARPLHDE